MGYTIVEDSPGKNGAPQTVFNDGQSQDGTDDMSLRAMEKADRLDYKQEYDEGGPCMES